MNFRELGLGPELLRATADSGYTVPTPIQEKAIPVALMGRDILGCAQTGTGKTAGYTLPMIEILAAGRARARMPRSLIIAPTRELATQISEAFDTYGKYHKLSKALLIGGTSFGDQERALDRGVDVLIATPGRFIDLFERGKILLSDVKILVIDEADRMLDMGFIPDVERIVSLLPKIRQTLFFSATMAPEIRRLADDFLINPMEIHVDPHGTLAMTVNHAIAIVDSRKKRAALRALIASEEVRQAIIFCNRKRDIGALVRDLKTHGFPAEELHGDMSQPSRTETMDAFRTGELKLLVASNVAARGIDVTNTSHVFIFDVPANPEDYIHRIGRTGRAGREGHAFTLATPEDGRYVAAIERLIGEEIRRIEIPGLDRPRLEEGGEGRGRKPARRAKDGAKRKGTGGSPAKPEARHRGKPAERREAQAREGAKAAKSRSQDKPRADEASASKPPSQKPSRSRAPKKNGGAFPGFGGQVPAFLLRPPPGGNDKKCL